MKHPNEPRREDSWLTLAELARVLDITDKAAREVEKYVPAKWVREGKPKRLYGRGAILLWAARQDGEPREDAEGIASPALERKREIECQLKLLDLATREGELVVRAQMRNYLNQKAVVDRHYSDVLVRMFGNAAGEVLQEWAEDIARIANDDVVEKLADGDAPADD